MLLLAQQYLPEKISLYLLHETEIPALLLITLQGDKTAEKLFFQSGGQLVHSRLYGCGGGQVNGVTGQVHKELNVRI